VNTPTDTPTQLQHIVLRTRIGLAYPPTIDREALEDRIAAAITEAIATAGGSLDVLQIGLAARPDWDQFGPTNRVTGAPLWDPGSEALDQGRPA
jgi:hypothetical protein